MKCYIFSIGEPTTELCKWSVERQGFEVVLYQDQTTLWEKLRRLYNEVEEDFIRVDADIIVNENIKKLEPQDNCWWHQSFGWDWYKQDLKPISVSYIKAQAISYLRANIDRFKNDPRPETGVYRIAEFHQPRRCEVYNIITGIHGYKQNDMERIKKLKADRNQSYDWELIEAINDFS